MRSLPSLASIMLNFVCSSSTTPLSTPTTVFMLPRFIKRAPDDSPDTKSNGDGQVDDCENLPFQLPGHKRRKLSSAPGSPPAQATSSYAATSSTSRHSSTSSSVPPTLPDPLTLALSTFYPDSSSFDLERRVASLRSAGVVDLNSLANLPFLDVHFRLGDALRRRGGSEKDASEMEEIVNTVRAGCGALVAAKRKGG